MAEVVADDGFEGDLDSEVVEAFGEEERVGVLAEWREHLGTGSNDFSDHLCPFSATVRQNSLSRLIIRELHFSFCEISSALFLNDRGFRWLTARTGSDQWGSICDEWVILFLTDCVLVCLIGQTRRGEVVEEAIGHTEEDGPQIRGTEFANE